MARVTCDQATLARVGAAQQNARAGALAGNAESAPTLLFGTLLRGQFLPDLGNLALQIGLEMIRSLVLGNLLEHHLQALQLLV